MGLFLRGNIWYMEYRTRRVRTVRTTGLRKEQKAKAMAAFEAFRLGMGARPKRSAMEGILSAIYDNVRQAHGVSLASVWQIYTDWREGKGRTSAKLTLTNMRNLLDRFVVWAAGRGLTDISDVSVSVARDYVVHMRASGKSNKTLRTYCQYMSSIWRAVGQMAGVQSNPWLAACPDPDGSSVRRDAFTPEEERRVLLAARSAGHDWWLASMISRWTGQRYGDVAMLEWSSVDLHARTISFRPSKTRKVGLRIVIPIAGPLLRALESVGKREGYVLPEHASTYPQPFDPPFSSILKAAELDCGKHTFHSWRHTFRTRLAEAGVPDQVAMRFGWTNLSTAARYDHARHLPEMKDAIDKLASAKLA